MLVNFNNYSSLESNKNSGLIKLSGSFISLDSNQIWDSILSISESVALNATNIKVVLNIDYISSTDVKYLFVLLKSLNQIKPDYSKMKVIWNYESFDQDHEELGLSLKACLPEDINFKLVDYSSNLAA